jgi:hypothetical protein
MKLSTASAFFILLLIANTIVFFKRDSFLFTKQVSYEELYPTVMANPVRGIKKINDSTLEFEMIKPVSGNVTWFLKQDEKIDSFNGIHPQVKAKPGVHNYYLSSPLYKDSIFARVEYVPVVKSNTGNAQLVLYRTNTSAITIKEILDQKYINDFVSITPQQRLALQKIIEDTIAITESMGTVQKVERICYYIEKKIKGKGSAVDQQVLGMNPFEQFLAASNGKVIDCGVYVRIFDLFASAAGVKSRMVEIRSNPKNVSGSIHELNEYFIPEKGEWAAVDLTFKLAAAFNGSGKQLNAVELKNTAMNDSSVNILIVSADTLTKRTFAEMGDSFFDLYGREKDLYFYETTSEIYNGGLVKRLKNFIFPVHWYTIYSDTHIVDNRNYYIKIFLMVLLLASIMLLGINILLRMNNK